jgi:peptidoglycan-associated lipoprotein
MHHQNGRLGPESIDRQGVQRVPCLVAGRKDDRLFIGPGRQEADIPDGRSGASTGPDIADPGKIACLVAPDALTRCFFATVECSTGAHKTEKTAGGKKIKAGRSGIALGSIVHAGQRLRFLIVVIAGLALISGCSRKIVKPDMVPAPGGPPGLTGPYRPGPVAEQELQVLQARLKTIHFDYDRYSLSPQAQAILQENAEILKMAPRGRIVAEGHCDERGTDEYNLALGERRARSATDYLVSLGVNPAILATVSYGSELPADPGRNEQAWAHNRRVFLRVEQ